MKLTYTKQGDYLIPDITIRQPRKALGHYGRLRKTYLQNFRPILFNELVFSDMLFEHCLEIEETARDRIDVIMSGLMKQYGITEELKAENQWSGCTSNISTFSEASVSGSTVQKRR